MSADISEMLADISFSSPHYHDILTRIWNGVLENVGWHFPEMSANILGKTQYVDWSWKLEQLRNFNNELVNICKIFKLIIHILNIFM